MKCIIPKEKTLQIKKVNFIIECKIFSKKDSITYLQKEKKYYQKLILYSNLALSYFLNTHVFSNN